MFPFLSEPLTTNVTEEIVNIESIPAPTEDHPLPENILRGLKVNLFPTQDIIVIINESKEANAVDFDEEEPDVIDDLKQ